MASETFNLAILLSLKDGASGGLDRFSGKLRAAEKDGQHFHETFEKIRADLNRDLAIGGVGVAGLGLMWQGIKVAGNFQASMTDLRSSLAQVGTDGKVNLTSLGKDMQKAEAIAMKLGNALPGTTEDFIQMMQVLKQNGLDTQTIMNGAADAVGNLAVANNALPKETAKDFAQFGQLFKLRPDEYIKAADTVSRLYTSAGIGTGELVEGLKYFQGRAGAALGITGLKDAEQVVRVMGLLRKQGLEGSVAGTSFNNLFMGYLAASKKKDNPIEQLKQLEGIDIKLFDDKGNFAGIDNLFKQLEPLQKLTEEKRLTYLKDIFGEEGMSAATAILKTGAEGWRNYNAEQSKTISLQQKNSEKAKDFNNQLEALMGSAKNLVVTAFEPMLPSLTSGINSLNGMVGSLQQFGKENQSLIKVLGTLALYGTTAMVVYSAFKTLTTGVKMFRLASAFSRGDGMIQFLNSTAQSASSASTSMATATTKANSLKQATSGLGGSTRMTIGVQIATIAGLEYIISTAISQYLSMKENERVVNEKRQEEGKTYTDSANFNRWFRGVIDADKALSEGKSVFNHLNRVENELTRALQGETSFQRINRSQVGNISALGFAESIDQYLKLVGGNSWETLTGSRYMKGSIFGTTGQRVGNQYQDSFNNLSIERLAAVLKKDAPTLKDPAAMAGFLHYMRQNFPEQSPKIEQAAQQAQPKAYQEAVNLLPALAEYAQQNQQKVSEGLGLLNQGTEAWFQSISTTQDPMTNLQNSLLKLDESSQKPNQPLQLLGTSAINASGSLDAFRTKVANFQMPTPQIQTFSVGVPNGTTENPSILNIPSKASGGRVKKSGLVNIHAGEEIVPADVTSRYEVPKNLLSSSSKRSISVNYSPQITINGGDKNAVKDFRAMLYEHKKDLERIVAERMNNGRVRA